MDAIVPAEEVTFDFRTLSARDRYKLMIGTVTPRPIALATTVDPQRRFNAAPFSFFNCLSADPPPTPTLAALDSSSAAVGEHG